MKWLAKIWAAIKDSAVYIHPERAVVYEMLENDSWDQYC